MKKSGKVAEKKEKGMEKEEAKKGAKKGGFNPAEKFKKGGKK